MSVEPTSLRARAGVAVGKALLAVVLAAFLGALAAVAVSSYRLVLGLLP